MFLYAALILITQNPTDNTAPTPDNGYGKYVEAANQIKDTKAWRTLYNRRRKDKSLSLYRDEAKLAGPIFALIQKGNSMPVYNPTKEPNEATLYPEFAYFREIEGVASDVATLRAADGDLESASQTLILADRFIRHIPDFNQIGVIVKQRMARELRVATETLLPRLKEKQIREQIDELQQTASNPPNIEEAAIEERGAIKRELHIDITDPLHLGIQDEQTDSATLFAKVLVAGMSAASPATIKVIQDNLNSIPPTKDDLDAVSKALGQSVPSISRKDREQFNEFLSSIKPQTYRISAYAKSLDPASAAHAELICNLALDSYFDEWVEAFKRPESQWWRSLKNYNVPDSTRQEDVDQVMKDGKAGKYFRVDLYALSLCDAISQMGGIPDVPTDFGKNALIERKKSRLAVIEARIQLYRVLHQRLPTSLESIGNPIDPDSGRPYLYRRVSTSKYRLSAVGFPGLPTIDQNT